MPQDSLSILLYTVVTSLFFLVLRQRKNHSASTDQFKHELAAQYELSSRLRKTVEVLEGRLNEAEMQRASAITELDRQAASVEMASDTGETDKTEQNEVVSAKTEGGATSEGKLAKALEAQYEISSRLRKIVADLKDELSGKEVRIANLLAEVKASRPIEQSKSTESTNDSNAQAKLEASVVGQLNEFKSDKALDAQYEVSSRLRQVISDLKAQLDERDGEIASLKAEIEASKEETIELKDKVRAEDLLNDLMQRVAIAKSDLEELEDKSLALKSIEEIKQKLETYENEHELIAVGLYPLILSPDTPDKLKHQLEEKRHQLADMVKQKVAAVCSTKWTINGSASAGARATRHYIRIMLRTFNADADACLDLVRWNNLDKCIKRIKSSFEYVNELGSSHETEIQEPYMNLRIEQLRLMHQYREAVHQKKEMMRAARQAAREEHRAQLEIEKARAEAEKEEGLYSKALDKAKADLGLLDGEERDRMLQRIAELETSLQKASDLKQRAISMAQITKAGFVYIVSNIGSFGPDVLKIGMTRRIDPTDRIRELGGASVPFPFDIHAMIYSENAPALENQFHRQFARERINLANGRKEFFRVPLESVIKFAETLELKAEFSSEIEAKDFRMSRELRESIILGLTDEELQIRIEALDKIRASMEGELDQGDENQDEEEH